MQITYDPSANVFAARIRFDQRTALVDAKWRWSAVRKRWQTDDPERVLPFEPFCDAVARTHLDEWKNTVKSQIDLSAAMDIEGYEPPCPSGEKYDGYQKAAILYAMPRKTVLIADPPGLGKTIEAIGVVNAMQEVVRRVLIICEASHKTHWLRSWKAWDIHGLSAGIVGSTKERYKDADGKARTRAVPFWPDTAVVIINYNIIETYADQIHAVEWDVLIVDEAHALSSEQAQRTKNVFGHLRKTKVQELRETGRKWIMDPKPIRAGKRLFLTGTPGEKPIKLWPLIKACDPQGLGKDYDAFTERYCAATASNWGVDVSGASNLPELQSLMRQRFMVRRSKTEALKDLPPKRRYLYPLPKDGLARLVAKEGAAYQSVGVALAHYEAILAGRDPEEIPTTPPDLDALLGALAERFGDPAEISYQQIAARFGGGVAEAFENLSAVRKELAVAKLPMVTKLSKEVVDSGEKLILFCVHTEVAEALRDYFPGAAYITGKVPPMKRQPEVDRFQADPACTVAIGNLHAMGKGFTMTAASRVDFAELHWVSDDIEQGEDRAWRRGQKNAVIARHFAVEDTMDERFVEVILAKQDVKGRMLDMEKAN